MSISSIASSTAATTTSSSSSSTSTSTFSADDFLSLLVEQLQNQDPLNPTDTSEVMSQMVSYASYQQEAATSETLTTISETLDRIESALDISV